MANSSLGLSGSLTRYSSLFKRPKGNRKSQISLMRCDSQCSFFDKGLYASNDSLRIEVAIEPFIESCFEIEEEQHELASL